MQQITDMLVKIYPKRKAFTIQEIDRAFALLMTKKIRRELYLLNKPGHRWEGQQVGTTLKPNKSGLVRIVKDFKYDDVHYKFLTKA